MALAPIGFDRLYTFPAAPLGAIFRTGMLPANQILIKVAGPRRGEDWMLLLGDSNTGAYPSPWYGAMEEIRDQPIWGVSGPVAIAATGPRVDQQAGEIVFPGYLVVRPGGGMGVFIKGEVCIDLRSGKRFSGRPQTVIAYDRWVIDVTSSGLQSTIMFHTGPNSWSGPR